MAVAAGTEPAAETGQVGIPLDYIRTMLGENVVIKARQQRTVSWRTSLDWWTEAANIARAACKLIVGPSLPLM